MAPNHCANQKTFEFICRLIQMSRLRMKLLGLSGIEYRGHFRIINARRTHSDHSDQLS